MNENNITDMVNLYKILADSTRLKIIGLLCEGEQVLSGFINKTSLITAKITAEESQSTAAKILDLVENATNKKAKVEKFITRFAKIYTPIVCLIALAIGVIPSLVNPSVANEWIYKALTFLVVSCPCALIISVPLSLFAGLGAASKKGVLIKGSNYLEALNNLDTLVFDKTGTMTKGEFSVTSIKPTADLTKEEILKIAAYGEVFSTHPIAKSILAAYKETPDQKAISNYEEIAGHGVRFTYQGVNYAVGNAKLANQNIELPTIEEVGTIVYVFDDHHLLGYIIIGDVIKDTAKEAIAAFKQEGIKQTVMLTGDQENVALEVKNKLGIDKVYAQLLPQDKVARLEEIIATKEKNSFVGFVGDGMNDAPVLARADIGFSMGGLGSDAAIEASDIVIMDDDVLNIATALKIAHFTRKITIENIWFSLGVKFALMILIILTPMPMWWGVFGDVGVCIITIFNSLRILKHKF